MWPDIPNDVIEYVRMVVRLASDEITERLANQPNIRESSLDDALVYTIGRFAVPKRLPSNTIVTIEVHNIGGLRQWRRWELADIAFLEPVRNFVWMSHTMNYSKGERYGKEARRRHLA